MHPTPHRADRGDPVHGIVSNPYLDGATRGIHCELSVRIEDDGRFFCEEDTVLEVAALPGEPLHHTDRNRLTKVG